MKTEWRPDDWVNPMKNCEKENCRTCEHETGIYEAGASAMLAALIKWLDEPCTKHPLERKDVITGCYRYKDHRYLCPQCLSELKEANK